MNNIRRGGLPYPIVDLHCDLLSYLASVEGAAPDTTDDIGCALPFLRDGNVKLQVLASYVPTEPQCVEMAAKEYEVFNELPSKHPGVVF